MDACWGWRRGWRACVVDAMRDGGVMSRAGRSPIVEARAWWQGWRDVRYDDGFLGTGLRNSSEMTSLANPGEFLHGAHCAGNDDALGFVLLVEGIAEV